MVIVTRSELRTIKSIEKKIQQNFTQKTIPTGIEICETQLYHLANKIKETKINKDVENYLPAINGVLEGIDREELIKKIVSVEFTRFSNYYNKTKDLNTVDSRESSRSRGDSERSNSPSSNGSVRYFINVGEKDGYDWMTLKDFLRETLSLGQEDVYKVDAKDSFSFFNTETEHTDKILAFFTDFKLNGRFINVEISQNPGGGDSGGYRGKKGKGKRRDNKFNDRGDRGGRSKGRERNGAKAKSSNSGKRRTKQSRSDFF